MVVWRTILRLNALEHNIIILHIGIRYSCTTMVHTMLLCYMAHNNSMRRCLQERITLVCIVIDSCSCRGNTNNISDRYYTYNIVALQCIVYIAGLLSDDLWDKAFFCRGRKKTNRPDVDCGPF
jgi:hypothetical protein